MSGSGGYGGSGFNDVAIGAAGSVLDTIYGAKKLFGRSGDHYGIHNRNAERTRGFVTPLSRVGLCFAALVVPAISAPIFIAIVLAAAVYYVGKMGYSIYKAYSKNSNEESRRRNKADIKANVIRAAIATALAIVVVALFFSPIGVAAAIALTAIAYAVSISYTIFAFVRLGREMTHHRKVDTPALPVKAELNVDRDLDIIHEAQHRVSYSEKPMLDNYFRMNRAEVISKISHQDNAARYLIDEMTDKINMLQDQIDRAGCFRKSLEGPKRLAKKVLLDALRSYTLYLHGPENQHEFDDRHPIDAFKNYAMTQLQPVMDSDKFDHNMRLARQSFFCEVGDFEDIMKAFEDYFRFRNHNHNQFASAPIPQAQQQQPPVVPLVPAPAAYNPLFLAAAHQAPEYQQPPAQPAPEFLQPPVYQQVPAGYQPFVEEAAPQPMAYAPF